MEKKELMIKEVGLSKMDQLKKELQVVELEERLEMIEAPRGEKRCNGRCDN